MGSTQPPLEYLLTSSQNSLQDFELARHGQISSLRKEFFQLFEEWIEAEIAARIARWILNGRRKQEEFCPVGTISSARGSAPQKLSPALSEHWLPFGDADPQPVSDRIAEDPSSRRGPTRAHCRDAAAPNCSRQPLAENKSEAVLRSPAISAEGSAALQLLEQSASCEARLFGDRGRRARRVHRKFARRGPMLPFPDSIQDPANVHDASRASPQPADGRLRADIPVASCIGTLHFPRSRPHEIHATQLREGANRSAKRDFFATRSPHSFLRKSPPSRASLRQLSFRGNVALSNS